LLQHTLRSAIAFLGVGLYAGRKVAMRVLPAGEDSGIRFLRKDVPEGRGLVRAHWRNVVDTEHRIVLGNEHGATVAAVGHLLSALKGCGVDNATVEIDGPQVPIMDGSIGTFVRMVAYAGRVRQKAKQRVIRIEKPVSVNHGFGFAALTPSVSPRFTLTKKAQNPDGPCRQLTFDLYTGCFRRELSWVRAADPGPWALNAAEDSAPHSRMSAAISEYPPLRSVDERLRHGIVASMGDLYLAGVGILGHYHGFRACHWTNHRLLWQVFRDTESWSCVRLSLP